MPRIRPSFPFIFILVAISFFTFAGMFFLSPFQDWKMLTAAVLFCSLAFTFLLMIDRGYLTIHYNVKEIKLEGFFLVKKVDYTYDQIEGYQIQEKVDQLNGFHEEIYLVLRNGKGILFPRIAYTAESYSEIKSLCESELKFLGNTTIKYGRIIGKVMTTMFLLSGIFAALVGLIKLLK
ncbi:MAG: hypothetical protein ACLFUB_20080 [Cyclobacteriaceae bacterium]